MFRTESRRVLCSVPIIFGTLLPGQSQDVVYPGSTVQGDILRGEGQFLKGMAWYELNAAKAREIDAKTAIELERWNREVYEPVAQRADRLARRSKLTHAQTEAAQARLQRGRSVRTNPTTDDIFQGDALARCLSTCQTP